MGMVKLLTPWSLASSSMAAVQVNSPIRSELVSSSLSLQATQRHTGTDLLRHLKVQLCDLKNLEASVVLLTFSTSSNFINILYNALQSPRYLRFHINSTFLLMASWPYVVVCTVLCTRVVTYVYFYGIVLLFLILNYSLILFSLLQPIVGLHHCT